MHKITFMSRPGTTFEQRRSYVVKIDENPTALVRVFPIKNPGFVKMQFVCDCRPEAVDCEHIRLAIAADDRRYITARPDPGKE